MASNDRVGAAFKALTSALYPAGGAPVVDGCYLLGAYRDLEDRLRATDFQGRFRIFAQDDDEEATHFAWRGRIGDFEFELEAHRGEEDCHVAVLGVAPAAAAKTTASPAL